MTLRVQEMDRDIFNFKQFSLHCSRHVFPLTTDAVLLGCWTDCSSANRVLDVGAGTGILSLMIAQRTQPNCLIYAIDDSPDAFNLGRRNFAESPWLDRLWYLNKSATDVPLIGIDDTPEPQAFDFIISNPPYFKDQLRADNALMNHAKHQHAFGFDSLAAIAHRYLMVHGILSVVLPVKAELECSKIMMEHRLYLKRITRVKHHSSSLISLVLLEYSKSAMLEHSNELVLFEKEHVRTKAWQELSEPFYL